MLYLLFFLMILFKPLQGAGFELISNILPEKGYYRVYQNVSGFGFFTTTGFNQSGDKKPLSAITFEEQIKLEDIFLGSKMSANDKLTIAPLFGSTKDEQYLNLLSKTIINLDVEESAAGLSVRSLYAIPTNKVINGSELCFALDMQLLHKTKTIKLIPSGENNITAGSMNVHALNQFFTDNIDFSSFFQNQVLKSKKLVFKEKQSVGGLSDITCFLYCRVADFDKDFNQYDGGLKVSFPTGKKADQKTTLGEINLCHDNALHAELFFNAFLQTNNKFFNPLIELRLGYRFPYHSKERLPRLKNETEVFLPPAFNGFTRLPFQDFDTTVRGFSDNVTPCRYSGAKTLYFSLANSIRHYMGSEFELIPRISFTMHEKQKIDALEKTKTYNTAILEADTQKHELLFSWHLRVFFTNTIRIGIGSQHTLWGKNTTAPTVAFGQIELSY